MSIFIDGIEYEADPGKNMLQVVLDNKLDLPYFCWHPAMGSVGACRLCAVKLFRDESDTQGKIAMACMTPAADGTRISIKDPEAAEFRRYVIEWLMTNHPHDCPVCDEGGECHLQDMTTMCGQVYRRFRGRKRTYVNQDLGPYINHEMNRCIQCYRCVRFYRDLAGGRDFDVFGSRNRVYFGRAEDGQLESPFSGNLVEVCPTGVFTDKTLKRHYTRKWDLSTAPSVCIHCGLGCNTIPGARYGEVRRVHARYNSDLNGYFICDRGRFGYEFINAPGRISQCRVGGVSDAESVAVGGLSEPDLPQPLLRKEGSRSASDTPPTVGASWDDALDSARQMLREAKGVVGIGSPRASLEANWALRKLVGGDAFSTGLSAFEHETAQLALKILREGPARTPSLAEVESADVILLLGADPVHEAPMLEFAIRQAMRKARLDISRALKIPDWDANAVATALQDERGKLHVASHGEVSPETMDDLRQARQPLVITSMSAGAEVLNSAAELARALHAGGKDCRLLVIVPEANTMGVVMLGGMSVEEALGRVESGEADTLVVVENDLPERVDVALFESAIAKAKNLIVLDHSETATTQRAGLVLPAAAYVECDGTFVNNECRAQRFYQVFVPCGDIRPAWQTLLCFAGDIQPRSIGESYEDVLRDLANEMPEFAPALEITPPAGWRSRAGQKVPREPHRFTGRTAKDANWTINEPRPPDDPETPLAFSMEGDQNPAPAALNPRYWWPGWNSMNSVTKFQIEVNGPLHGGDTGKRLIEPEEAR